MGRKSTPSFVLTLKLNTELYQEDILNKRFEIGRNIYNSLLNVTYKRYKEMVKTNAWKSNQIKLENLFKKYKGKPEELKVNEEYKSLLEIRKQLITSFRMSEFDFHTDIIPMKRHFNENIDISTAQKIASRVWKSIESLLYGKGEEVSFKKYGQFNSFEGKSNRQGIVFRTDTLNWLDLKINIQMDDKNMHEIMSLQNKVKYCRIVRKWIRDKYKFYIQIVLEGVPPPKIDKTTDEFKHPLVKGDVGLDIGVQTLAVTANSVTKLLELAPDVNNIERDKRLIQRYLNRSREANNPNNFNKDRTIKKGIMVNGKKEKLTWVKSKRYLKAESKLRELQRKQADIRKLNHYQMIRYLESLGDKFTIEDMNYKALQKRSKKTEVSEKTGRIKCKKRFGKSLANKAPAMFVTMLKSRNKVYEIDTKKIKASQYNHYLEEYIKKKLSQRWNDINGQKVQRDLYSSFLLQNVDIDKMEINQQLCVQNYPHFLEMHNIEINRLNLTEQTKAIKNIF